MTTFQNLELTMIDMRDRVQREVYLGDDALKASIASLDLVIDAATEAKRSIQAQLNERNRALMNILGNPKPTPETVDMIEAKPVKSKKVEEVDA